MVRKAEQQVLKSYIVYDGDCPFCSSYVGWLRLREAVGQIELINARKGGEVLCDLGVDQVLLEREMMFIYQGETFTGADAIHMLALLSTRYGIFNRSMVYLFSSKSLAHAIYPMLRIGRNITLQLLGRERLNRRA